MKVVSEFSNRIQAEMWAGPLKENGIPFIIQSQDCGGTRPELTAAVATKVLIAEHDLDRVKKIYPERENN